MLHKFMQLTY